MIQAEQRWGTWRSSTESDSRSSYFTPLSPDFVCLFPLSGNRAWGNEFGVPYSNCLCWRMRERTREREMDLSRHDVATFSPSHDPPLCKLKPKQWCKQSEQLRKLEGKHLCPTTLHPKSFLAKLVGYLLCLSSEFAGKCCISTRCVKHIYQISSYQRHWGGKKFPLGVHEPSGSW